MTSIDLAFTNSHDFPVSLTGITVIVRKVDAPNADAGHSCAVADFTVDQSPADFRVTLPARTTSSLSALNFPRAMWPRMGMLNRPVNQDGCKGAALTLRYTASGMPRKP
jgi:hypothetical protein